MSKAIVYSFAVDPSLRPVVGAPSMGVLARQIPRLVVGRLNGGGDRGLRFFPLLGPRDGRRQFFVLPDLLPPEQLAQMHGQSDGVALVVDGRIEAKGVRVRVFEAASLRERFDAVLALDPLDPLPMVTRLMYELSDLLEWSGPLPKLPELAAPDLSYFLVAKDDLLSLEAGFERDGEGHWLQAITMLAQTQLEQVEVRDLLLEICGRLAAAQQAKAEVVALLRQVVERIDDSGFLATAAALLQAQGEEAASSALLDRLVGRPLVEEATVLRLSGHLFRNGRHQEGRRQLELALEHGRRTPRVLAQLLVFHQRLGQRGPRRALAVELAECEQLPSAVGRLLCSELIEFDLFDQAVAVVRRCLDQEPESPILWLELGRALMHAGAAVEAGQALDTALQHAPPASVGDEVKRLRRFVERPQILAELARLDAALGVDDLDQALVLAEALTVQYPDLAEGFLFLGIVQQRFEQPQPAIDAFRRALALDPGLGEAHNRLGILLVGASEHQLGYDHLQLAVAQLPRESGPRIHLAQACSYLDRADEGRAALAAATRLGARPDLVESVRRAFFAENS